MNVIFTIIVISFSAHFSHAQSLKEGETVTVEHGYAGQSDVSCEIRKSFTGNIEFSMHLSEDQYCKNPVAMWSEQKSSQKALLLQTKNSDQNFPQFRNIFLCKDNTGASTGSGCGVAVWQISGRTSALRSCTAKAGQNNSAAICSALQVCQSGFLSYVEARHATYPATVNQSDVQETQAKLGAIWNRFGCK